MFHNNKERPHRRGRTSTGENPNNNSNYSTVDNKSQELLRLKSNRELMECALEDAGGIVDGDNVCCPFHKDSNPSGSIHQGDGDGSLLYTCHGCEWNNGKATGDVIAVTQHANNINFQSAIIHLRSIPFGQENKKLHDPEGLQKVIMSIVRKTRKKPINAWTYFDVNEQPVLRVVRFENENGDKTYRPIRWDGNEWVASDPPGQLPIYRLPDILRAIRRGETIYVVEGEECADALWRIGIPATTSAYGAKSAKKTDWSPLAGKEIIILPDNDAAGRKYAEDVVGIASKLNPPPQVKIVELPGLPASGDVVDYLEAQESKDTDTQRERIEALVNKVQILAAGCTPRGEATSQKKGFDLRPLADLLSDPPEEVPWIVDGLLPASGFSFLVAKPKVGKSTTSRPLALSVARGEKFLGLECKQGLVIYLALEDKKSEVIEHFRAMGVTTAGENILIHVGPAPHDPKEVMKSLRELVNEHNPVLIIIDTLLRFIRLRDANDYPSVIAALDPLLELARSSGCHIMALHHTVKAGGRQDGDSILGSTAFFATADTILTMEKNTSGVRTLKSVQRYGDDMPQTILVMDPNTRRITSATGTSIKCDSDIEFQITIMNTLKDGSLSESAIRTKIKGDNKKIAEALQAMVDSGSIFKIPNPGRGGGYKYSLPTAPLENSEKLQANSDFDESAVMEPDVGEAA